VSRRPHLHDSLFGEQLGLFMASELASELYVDEVLAGDGSLLHVDTIGSVRGLRRDEDTFVPSGKIIRP